MKRNLRHILPLLSFFVAVFVGTWLVVPHDVCLTKLVVSQRCVCLPTSGSVIECSCCVQGVAGKIIDCSDAHDGTGETHTPGCFSISSDFSEVTSPERGPDTEQVINLGAVLPISPVFEIHRRPAQAWYIAGNDGLNQTGLFRDICVYRI